MDDMEPQLISIGDDVTISYCVKFCIHGKNQSHTPLIIKSGAYIGMGALLVSGKTGITIGENSIVGAGSVVVQSLPSHSVAVGVPATVIRSNK